jgi:hypothetical protein
LAPSQLVTELFGSCSYSYSYSYSPDEKLLR